MTVAPPALVGGGIGTFLVKMARGEDQGGIIYGGHSINDIQDSTNLAVDAAQGDTQCILTSNPGLSIGQIVLIDEDTYIHTEPDVRWWTLPSPPNPAPPNANSDPDFTDFCRRVTGPPLSARSIGQMMEITSITTTTNPNDTIHFATPFHHTFKTANLAQLTRYNSNALVGIGIEELALIGAMGPSILFTRAAYCWYKHIEGYYSRGASGHFQSYRSEIRDSYFHETPAPIFGGSGYLLCMSYPTSDSIIHNCISWNGNKVVVMQGSGGGNVFSYNYTDDAWGSTYPNLPEAGVNAAHFISSHMELFEGNYSHKYQGDSYWGNIFDVTCWRNHFSALRAGASWLGTPYYVTIGGVDYPYCDEGGQTGRNAVDVQSFNYRNNFVGNVLGYNGQALLNFTFHPGPNQHVVLQTDFNYENVSGYQTAAHVYMWVFGGNQMDQRITVGGGWGTWDTSCITTMLRQGNWDWVTGSQVWYANPIGATGSSSTGTPKPIVPSLYLTSAPDFFLSNSYAANRWPWVDPSTGITYKLPAKERFLAGTPNLL